MTKVALTRIDANPMQPRRHFEEQAIVELANSLRADGLLHPPVVASRGRRFVLVSGERRFRAARHLGWKRIEVRIVEADDERLKTLALVENLQRQDLNDVERARAIRTLKESENLTWAQVAERVGVGRRRILQLVKLLEAPDDVLAMVERGETTERAVRAMVKDGVSSSEMATRLSQLGEPRCTPARAWERSLRRLEKTVDAIVDGDERDEVLKRIRLLLERAKGI